MPRPGTKIQLARKLASLGAEDRREVIEFSRELAAFGDGGGTTAAPKAARRKPAKARTRKVKEPEPEPEPDVDEPEFEEDTDDIDDDVDFEEED